MKIRIPAIIAFFVLSAMSVGCVAVQTVFSLDPGNKTGFIAERLDRIDAAIKAEIEAGKLPGAVALIVRDGKTIYHKSFGHADIASQAAMQKDSIFRIASMSKAVTTVGVMQLYEQGLFLLNDPLSKYIPAFANPRVLVSSDEDGTNLETRPAKREIRIIDLLTHSAGISYPFIESPLQSVYKQHGIIDGLTQKNLTLAAQMARLAEMPLLFDPGSAWAYGLSTDVLGYLIEVVSGTLLDRYFEEEIFAPLAMEDSYFYLPADKAGRLVTLYADVDGLQVAAGDESEIYLDNPNYPVEGAHAYFSGGAGLSSTADDYARFIEMLLNDGELEGARVLGRKAVDMMRTARIDRDGDGDADFGLGFEVIEVAGELGSPGTYRWGGAFFTSYWIDPEEKLVAVFMSQVRPSDSDFRARFSNLVYQALE